MWIGPASLPVVNGLLCKLLRQYLIASGCWNLSGGVLTYLTVNPDHYDQQPFWAPNGERVGFMSSRATGSGLYWKRRDGTGESERLTPVGNPTNTGFWSPDGNTLAYEEVAPNTLNDIWLLNYPENKAEVFLSTIFREGSPAFSPDGRWIAYVSDESGIEEIYLRPFPAKEPKVTISNEGGQRPFWSPDGSELFYLSGRQLMVVPMQYQPSLNPGISEKLFELPPGFELANGMSSDGKKFLALKSGTEGESNSPHLVVVMNWFKEVKQKTSKSNPNDR